MGEETVLPRVFNISELLTHLKNILSFNMCLVVSKMIFQRMGLWEKKAHKKHFLKNFFLLSEISRVGRFKHISSFQIESGRACIISITIIHEIKLLTKMHTAFYGI